jgi:hypothetical protein
MNFACDADCYVAWAEATSRGRLSRPITRKYNAALIFKRAEGRGRIQRIEGLDALRRRLGEHLVAVELLPVGAPRRDWLQTLISDGYVVVRHPDLATAVEMADLVGSDLRLYAG